MKPSFLSNLKHPIFIGGVVLVLVIGAGSFAYYKISQQPPQYNYVEAKTGTVVQQVTETGTVSAATEADLGFQASGQIAQVYVSVGEHVAAGQVLASLDNADLSAQVASAQADVQARAGQAGLAPGRHAAAAARDRPDRRGPGEPGSGEHLLRRGNHARECIYQRERRGAQADRSRSSPTRSRRIPLLTFQVADAQETIDVESARVMMTTVLNAWQVEAAGLNAVTPSSTIDAAIGTSQQYLADVQSFLNKVNNALNGQVGLSATTLASYQTALTTAQTEVGASLSATVGLKQNIASEEAAITQAQNSLNLDEAGATADDIAAQAAAVSAAQAGVLNAQAQLEKTLIRAPIAGTITKSEATIGENASPGTPVISLSSNGLFQVDVYLSDDEVAEVNVGDPAAITLDAYPGITFPATVTSVDSAQTVVNGAPAYKAVLQFTQNDPRLRADLTANASITTATHPNVVESRTPPSSATTPTVLCSSKTARVRPWNSRSRPASPAVTA